MKLKPEIQKYLEDELFDPRVGSRGQALSEKIAAIPIGGDLKTTAFWTARIALIRELLFVGRQSKRAQELLSAIAQPAFAEAVRKTHGVSMAEVTRELKGGKFDLSSDQVRALKVGFLKPFAKGSGKDVEATSFKELMNELFVPDTAMSELADYVAIEESGLVPAPTTPAEKRVWAAFEEVQRVDSQVKSIADILVKDFRVQSEGYIDSREIDADLLLEASKSLGKNFKTGSPEQETRANLIRRLQAVSDPAEIVSRHTLSILSNQADGHVSKIRRELRLKDGSYQSSARTSFSNRILEDVNDHSVLDEAVLDTRVVQNNQFYLRISRWIWVVMAFPTLGLFFSPPPSLSWFILLFAGFFVLTRHIRYLMGKKVPAKRFFVYMGIFFVVNLIIRNALDVDDLVFRSFMSSFLWSVIASYFIAGLGIVLNRKGYENSE